MSSASQLLFGSTCGSLNIVVPPQACDMYYNQVVSLLRFNGTPGSTSLIDETGKTWSTFGSFTLSDTQVKFGATSGSFPVDSASYATTADSDDFSFGSGDYTIEAFVYPFSNSGIFQILDKKATSEVLNLKDWVFLLNNGKVQLTYWTAGNTQGGTVISTNTVTANAWNHVAFTKQGTTYRVFINGVLEDQQVFTDVPESGSNPLYLGRDPGDLNVPDRDYEGYIDSVRLTKGVARYTTSFTAPLQDYPSIACM